MSDETHDFVPEFDMVWGWCATCSCGWDGPRAYDTEGAAGDAWEDHCDDVFLATVAADHTGSEMP